MAGLVGGGGLVDLANRYGHIRYETDVMCLTVRILIVIDQGIQMTVNYYSAQFKRDYIKACDEHISSMLFVGSLFKEKNIVKKM